MTKESACSGGDSAPQSSKAKPGGPKPRPSEAARQGDALVKAAVQLRPGDLVERFDEGRGAQLRVQ